MRYFCGIETNNANREQAEVLLQSVPYDGTSTWGKGADKGFEAFMDACDNMETYDIETDSEIYRKGIHILPELKDFDSPEAMYQAVYENAKKLLRTDTFITHFGGEHSISIGVIKAHYEHYDTLSVLQLDAHADLRAEYQNSPYNHACALHDASQHTNLVQVGIRSMDRSEIQYVKEENIFYASSMHGNTRWMQDSIDRLTKQVYITLDLDAFDPSILPATGTPEPGGMGWYDMLTYLRMVFEQRKVVGFDIVELAPIPGQRASEFLVAKLYYKMLSYKFALNVS